jgi:hypothetical protein
VDKLKFHDVTLTDQGGGRFTGTGKDAEGRLIPKQACKKNRTMYKLYNIVFKIKTYLLLPGGLDPGSSATNIPHHRRPPLCARRPTRIGASGPRLQVITA